MTWSVEYFGAWMAVAYPWSNRVVFHNWDFGEEISVEVLQEELIDGRESLAVVVQDSAERQWWSLLFDHSPHESIERNTQRHGRHRQTCVPRSILMVHCIWETNWNIEARSTIRGTILADQVVFDVFGNRDSIAQVLAPSLGILHRFVIRH
jgi:hypothetical protein